MDEVVSSKNPIIPGRGVCDPHIKVFGNRAYLYASHDVSPNAEDYLMRDWQIWSSDDLKRWRWEASVDPADFYTGPTDEAWAVDVAERNGQYYFYFSDGNQKTGVAVSDSPIGPWRDPLGAPLLDGSITGGRDYDPTVLVDDDGAAYIVVGGPEWAYPGQGGYFIARLGDDMISLAEIPRRLEVNHPADDKPSLNKIAGRYYLTWAAHVSVSDSVYGPYQYLGNTGASLDHGCYFEWQGQLYNAFTIFDPSLYYRASGLCYVHVRDDSMLEVDQLIVEYGVRRYLAEWNKVEAEWFSSVRGGVKTPSFRGGFVVSFDQSGSVSFDGVEGGAQSDTLVVCGGAWGVEPSSIRILVDGVPLEPHTLPVNGLEPGPRFFVERIAIPSVTREITIEVQPSAGGLVELDWWSLRTSAR